MKSKLSAIDRNKEPILDILKKYLNNKGRLIEIGSGNAEHAVYIANYFKQIEWVCTEKKDKLAQITTLLKKKQIKNIHGPTRLQVGSDDFPKGRFDYVLTINTLHIMSWKENKALFKLLGKRLREDAYVFFYGPFNINQEFTSQGNKDFDELLKKNNPASGIRNIEDVNAAMEKAGFTLENNHEMPTNNKMLVFKRLKFSK